MKLYVVHNKDGEILAAARTDTSSPIRVRPQADERAGQLATEIYVPAVYQHYDLAGICQRLRVDTKGKFAELKLKE
jgi:hypothetical protein